MKTTFFAVLLSALLLGGLPHSTAKANEPTSGPIQLLATASTAGVPAQAVMYDWRYRYYGGRWWYWTPQNNWVYWYGDNWVPYSSGVTVYAGPRYYTGYRGVYPGYGYVGPGYYNYYGPRRYYNYFGRRPYRW